MTIAQEEIFGPVLVVIPFDDDDDAVRIANDSSYGLAGAVFSGVARALAGRRPPDPHRHASASTAALTYGADLPFGGYKHERHRPPERHRRLRPVPRDQVGRLAGRLTPGPRQPP